MKSKETIKTDCIIIINYVSSLCSNVYILFTLIMLSRVEEAVPYITVFFIFCQQRFPGILLMFSSVPFWIILSAPIIIGITVVLRCHIFWISTSLYLLILLYSLTDIVLYESTSYLWEDIFVCSLSVPKKSDFMGLLWLLQCHVHTLFQHICAIILAYVPNILPNLCPSLCSFGVHNSSYWQFALDIKWQ